MAGLSPVEGGVLAGEGWLVVCCFRCAEKCAAAALDILAVAAWLAGGEGGFGGAGFCGVRG